MSHSQELDKLEQESNLALSKISTKDQLETFRVEYLGRKGKISNFLRTLKDLPIEERRTVGEKANKLRIDIEEQFEKKNFQFSGNTARKIDVTIPGRRPPVGHLHPLTIIRREIEDLFLGMGFKIADTPEVEEAKYNFDLVNIPLGHPARDLMDTFWLNDSRLLRTHTSAGQGRVMPTQNPPFRILIPGRVFRKEATDASHETTFYQFEGMMVDRNITLAHLKGVIATALKKILRRSDLKFTFRPSYFPFVEPGLETHVSCLFCKHGCSVCKGTGWIEVLPAGMIHPNVLKNVNVDPKKYQGFAFGGSIDRLAMLRFGINDIRLFWSSDPHFLRQF